jgi:hypothetical protein
MRAGAAPVLSHLQVPAQIVAIPLDPPTGQRSDGGSPRLEHFQVPRSDWEAVADVLFGRLHALLQRISDSDSWLLRVDTVGVLRKASAGKRGVFGDWQNEIHPTPGRGAPSCRSAGRGFSAVRNRQMNARCPVRRSPRCEVRHILIARNVQFVTRHLHSPAIWCL